MAPNLHLGEVKWPSGRIDTIRLSGKAQMFKTRNQQTINITNYQMTSNRQQFTFEKLIKENAILEDFNQQNPRTLGKPN